MPGKSSNHLQSTADAASLVVDRCNLKGNGRHQLGAIGDESTAILAAGWNSNGALRELGS
jgi:hypothetical protein